MIKTEKNAYPTGDRYYSPVKKDQPPDDNLSLRSLSVTLFPNRKRIVITVFILAVLIFAGIRLLGKSNGQPKYQTAQVQRGDIVSMVSESGNVNVDTQLTINSPINGVIETLYVNNGDTVRAGQNLFKVRSTASAQQQAAAYASYQSAVAADNSARENKMTEQAQLEKDRQSVIDASTNVTNMQNNLNVSAANPATKLAYTQNDIDSINSALTSARDTFTADQQKYEDADAAIGAAAAQVNSTGLSYQLTQDSVVAAPVSGTIANISVLPGASVVASSNNSSNGSTASGLSSTGSSAILIIGDLSRVSVTAQVSEVDIPSIKVNQKAVVTLDSLPGKTFVGQVDKADSIGTITSGVVTYNVHINLLSPPPAILSGMSATVDIETARHTNVLYVPTATIQVVNGQQIIRVINNGTVSQMPVTTGLSSGTDTEIISGLSEGQTVVVSGGPANTAQTGGASPFSA
jgi:membrane fusion protein, macrolide-specific efflux system